jgi:hypothetical protein
MHTSGSSVRMTDARCFRPRMADSIGGTGTCDRWRGPVCGLMGMPRGTPAVSISHTIRTCSAWRTTSPRRKLLVRTIPQKVLDAGRNRRPASGAGWSARHHHPRSDRDVRDTLLAMMAQSVDQLRTNSQPLVVFALRFHHWSESARVVHAPFHVEHRAASHTRLGW